MSKKTQNTAQSAAGTTTPSRGDAPLTLAQYAERVAGLIETYAPMTKAFKRSRVTITLRNDKNAPKSDQVPTPRGQRKRSTIQLLGAVCEVETVADALKLVDELWNARNSPEVSAHLTFTTNALCDGKECAPSVIIADVREHPEHNKPGSSQYRFAVLGTPRLVGKSTTTRPPTFDPDTL